MSYRGDRTATVGDRAQATRTSRRVLAGGDEVQFGAAGRVGQSRKATGTHHATFAAVTTLVIVLALLTPETRRSARGVLGNSAVRDGPIRVR